jgi:hypothetical protein
MPVELCFTCEPFGRRQGGCASLGAHLLSKNYTRGDEDVALTWQTEGAGQLQLVTQSKNLPTYVSVLIWGLHSTR